MHTHQRQIGPIETNRFSNNTNFPTKFFFIEHFFPYRLMLHHSPTLGGVPRTMGGTVRGWDQGLEAKSSPSHHSESVQN